MQSALRAVSTTAAALLLAALSACSAMRSPGSLQAGTPIEEARQSLGAGVEYPLADGGRRLEINRGRETYMVDFDATGRLVSSQQVLSPATFDTITIGMTEQQ